jgi:hypothetical protein
MPLKVPITEYPPKHAKMQEYRNRIDPCTSEEVQGILEFVANFIEFLLF